ncbi:hypothetical protein BC938DRAFT_481053 [Jimgerdemannia flammicorona]|uniref:Uncharacterized protein n=1 Tax=Jimgerdemannia flammicorona TaxID=994334 RepID=A0A433QX16_9FUNG|nr:hypothetical protein BC938DRAFT_481053 [Jimgerdemannia flammicorona]
MNGARTHEWRSNPSLYAGMASESSRSTNPYGRIPRCMQEWRQNHHALPTPTVESLAVLLKRRNGVRIITLYQPLPSNPSLYSLKRRNVVRIITLYQPLPSNPSLYSLKRRNVVESLAVFTETQEWRQNHHALPTPTVESLAVFTETQEWRQNHHALPSNPSLNPLLYIPPHSSFAFFILSSPHRFFTSSIPSLPPFTPSLHSLPSTLHSLTPFVPSSLPHSRRP